MIAGAAITPRCHVRIMLVIALRLAFRRLILFAEVAAARFVALQGVDAHQLTKLEEIGHTTGLFEALVQVIAAARNVDVLPELIAESADLAYGLLQSGRSARHAAFVPHDFAEFAMEGVDGALALDGEELVDGLLDAGHGITGLRV